jgi:hypothetical protein
MAEDFVPILADQEEGGFVPVLADQEESGFVPVPVPVVAEEESDQTVLGSVARGAGAGLVSAVQGIGELGAMGLEAAGVVDEGSQEATTKFFQDSKEALGFTPERAAGKVVEQVVNYGSAAIPVLGWVSKAGRASAALKAGTAMPAAKTWFGKSAVEFGKKSKLPTTRTGRAALTTAGTGVADFLVSPSTNTTLADSWDAMPEQLRTEDEDGLTGKALSAVRLRNKFKLGLEGAMFNAAGEILLPVIGGTVRSAAMVPGVPATARALSKGLEFLGDKATSVPFVRRYLTPNGFTPPEIADAVRTAEGMGEAEQTIASRLLSNYDTAIKKAVGFQGLKKGGSKAAVQRAYNETMDYMTGDLARVDFLKSYGQKATDAVDAMRMQVDDLSANFKSSIDTTNLDAAAKKALKDQFDANQGSYIRRVYALHTRPDDFTTPVAQMPQYKAALNQVTSYMMKTNPQYAADPTLAAQQAAQEIDRIFNQTLNSTGLTPEARKQALKYTKGSAAPTEKGRSSLFSISKGMLEGRSDMLTEAPLLREMMGEIRDPKEAFLRTVDSLSTTMAGQRVFDTVSGGIDRGVAGNLIPRNAKPLAQAVAEMNNGARPMVIDGTNLTERQAADLTGDMGYVKAGEIDPNNPFGGKFGSLSGSYVPVEVYNALTMPARAYSGAQDALAVSLQLKGVSQMAKTVLNPLSQVRNFISNTFVVGANGLVGRNMGVLESAEVLLANAIDSPEQYKLLRAMSDEGAIGQNIQVNELTRLMKEQVEGGVSARLRQAGESFRGSKVGAPVRFMEKTYKLGDDYWKVVGALGEKARYGAAMRKAGIDIDNLTPAVQDALTKSGLSQRSSSVAGTDFGNMFVTDIVRQTMPTYSMVPEAIKQLRRIPVVGNFMAFPAEIIRTSGNIVSRSLKEMGFQATDDLVKAMGKEQADIFARQVRAIGAQRLSGYVAMAGAAPIAFKSAAHDMLGVTEAEEDILQSGAAPWTKGNTLVYLTKPDEKGEAEYLDLSYMLPYEFMLTPARAAMQEYFAKGSVDAGFAEQVSTAAWEGFKKFAEPFASESMAAERIIDVTTRQGKTQTGAEIYEPAEPLGDRLSKSLTHVVGAFIPGIVDQVTTVKGGEFVEGRTLRAFTGTPSKQGDEYTPFEEAGTMLTGLRALKLNIPRSLSYAGSEYSGLRSSAVSIFTKVADDNDATNQDILNAYVKANDARRRQQASLKAKIDTAMAAGMSRREIYKAFDNSGVSNAELSNIIKNRYVPIKISRALIREVRQEVNQKEEARILQRLPKQEINDIRRSLMRTEIVPTEEVEESFAPVPAAEPQFVPQPVAAPQPQAAPSFVDTASEAVTGAADSFSDLGGNLLQRARTLAPGLLGDPRNQEIVDRSNR